MLATPSLYVKAEHFWCIVGQYMKNGALVRSIVPHPGKVYGQAFHSEKLLKIRS